MATAKNGILPRWEYPDVFHQLLLPTAQFPDSLTKLDNDIYDYIVERREQAEAENARFRQWKVSDGSTWSRNKKALLDALMKLGAPSTVQAEYLSPKDAYQFRTGTTGQIFKQII